MVMREFAQFLSNVPDTPLVAFIGDISRTRYDDYIVIADTMRILQETREFICITGGQVPFDSLIEYVADTLRIENEHYGPEEEMERLRDRYERPVDMLDGVCLLVGFPEEGVQLPESRCAQPIVPSALSLGVPTVSVTREGKVVDWCSKGRK